MAHDYKLFEAPGIFTRCDKQASCFPYWARDQASLDFLCCEDAGWVGAHVLNPAAIILFFGWSESDGTGTLARFMPAVIVAFWFEVLEIVLLIVFKNFIFTTTAETDLETLAGSVLGDAFINGTLGAIIGYQICTYVDYVPPFRRWRHMANNWHRAKYVFLFLLFELCFALLSVSNWFAPYVFLMVGAVAIVLLAVWIPFTSYDVDIKLVWRGARGVIARNEAFYLYIMVAIFIYIQNCGLEYMANDWYQVWFASLAVIFILGLMNKTKNYQQQPRQSIKT